MEGMSNYRLFAQAYRRQARRTVPTAALTPVAAPVLTLPAGPAFDEPVQQHAA
jgi:hypothetical protein